MGRRRKWLDQDDDDSSTDASGEEDDVDEEADAQYRAHMARMGVSKQDLDDEANLFYESRKKRPRRTKEDATYGIFAEDDDHDDDNHGGSRRGGVGQKGSSKYMSGVRFVASRKGTGDAGANAKGGDEDEEGTSAEDEAGNKMQIDEDEQNSEGEAGGEGSDEDVSQRPGLGAGTRQGLGFGGAGLGFGGSGGNGAGRGFGGSSASAGLGYAKSPGAGLGFGASQRGGLGSTPSTPASQVPLEDFVPSEFSSSRSKRANGRPSLGMNSPTARFSGRDSPASARGSPKPGKDFGVFEKYTKGIGSKLLAQMGYEKGMGLGREGQGIAEPIDVKVRPKGKGIGHGGFDERTDAVKRDQRLKGITSDDEMADVGASPAKAKLKSEAWKKGTPGKKKRNKVAYKTADEIIAEQEDAPLPVTADAGQSQKIIDMTGKEARVLSDLSAISASQAIETTQHLPELRHNLRLIADLAQNDLMHVTRQIRIEAMRREGLERDLKRLEVGVADEATRIARLKEVNTLASECAQIVKSFEFECLSIGSNRVGTEALQSCNLFASPFTKLETEYFEEFVAYGMDEVVVASLAPIFKRALGDWDPLTEPTAGADVCRRWRKLLVTPTKRGGIKKGSAGTWEDARVESEGQEKMTPYEALLWHVWVPKLRQAINNEWSPRHPDAIISLLEAWHPTSASLSTAPSDTSSLLPPWLHANLLDQLIMPKVEREVDAWDRRKNPIPIHTWIHPWLPVLGDRLERIHAPIRRKLAQSLADWHPRDDTALALLFPWKEVFPQTEMDSLLTRTVLPKLVQTLRLDFSINPAAQDTTPLLWIFRWHALLPGHLLVHLLETEFFPVWHRILWAWLSSPGANHDEIVQWYTSWKSFFPPFLQAEEGIKRQFKAGLDFMNRALSGGAGGVMPPIPGPIALEKAGVGVGLGANGLTSAQAAEKIREDKRRKAATAKSNEVTFREYVERVASARDVTFLPAQGKVHPQTGKPLFLMAEGGGVGGLLCYIEDGVVFVSEGEKWVPVSVEEAVERVVKGKGKR